MYFTPFKFFFVIKPYLNSVHKKSIQTYKQLKMFHSDLNNPAERMLGFAKKCVCGIVVKS